MIFGECLIAILYNLRGILQVSHIFFQDYFLVLNSLVNTVCDCTIIPGFKSDHSIVTISMHFTNEQRGSGYFKINNSLLLQSEYQIQIKNTINETATNNVDANPNVLWEVIKGSIRNTTIQYVSKMKKRK